MAHRSSSAKCTAPGSGNLERTGNMISGPPPSYSASTAYHLCPEELSGNERDAPTDSHPDRSHASNAQQFAFNSDQSDDNIRRSNTCYRPSPFPFDPSENLSSTSHCLMSTTNASNLSTRRSASQAPSTIIPGPSPRPIANMNPIADEKITEMAKNLISKNPELRNNIYSLLGSTMAAAQTIQPQDLKARDAKIEALQKQLSDAHNHNIEQTARIGQLEADLKLAVDTGLEQVDALEDLQHRLEDRQHGLEDIQNRLNRAETAEKNLRAGTLAINSKYEPMKKEHESLKKRYKAAEKEISRLKKELDIKDTTVGAYYNQAKDSSEHAARIQADLKTLQRANHELMVKGGQMSGRLMDVAEEWHETGMGIGLSPRMGMAPSGTGMGPPGAGAGAGVAGGRKRQALEVLDDGERLRRFSRMTR